MITVRTAVPEDLAALRAILQACEMPGEFSTDNCLVAFEKARPVGFARLEFVGEIPYIRPVAILPAERGKGIGTRLLRIVLETHPEVRVVSRGMATEFYRILGFQRMSWEEVHPLYWEECEQCPDKAECKPSPMVRLAADQPEHGL